MNLLILTSGPPPAAPCSSFGFGEAFKGEKAFRGEEAFKEGKNVEKVKRHSMRKEAF